ncbi:hypothetical protein ACW9ID_22550 [Pseudomonas gingeri]|uniref:hypothetical protein n=2 Tax=Pseudomonas gingeri TaxID=117681 RepID=UPI0015A47790|nr:hypothetical protein [Pseudomonas gingeri]NVZ78202.1 hypothetical protein [Pseudomonas gingeri]
MDVDHAAGAIGGDDHKAIILARPSSGLCQQSAAERVMMGQKWGKPYANPCHSMPTMHFCKRVRMGASAHNHGPFLLKPLHTPAQLAYVKHPDSIVWLYRHHQLPGREDITH